MVEVVEWAAVGCPLTGPRGEKLFGGHSWRVSGASFFAAAGVEVIVLLTLSKGTSATHWSTPFRMLLLRL
eukprot:510824-Amphidinium_carterae.1